MHLSVSEAASKNIPANDQIYAIYILLPNTLYPASHQAEEYGGPKWTSCIVMYCKGVSEADPIVRQVWPGATHFPDFLHSSIQAYWEEQLRAFHSLLAYDGIWIDMNEASNFCSGEVCQFPNVPKDAPASPFSSSSGSLYTLPRLYA